MLHRLYPWSFDLCVNQDLHDYNYNDYNNCVVGDIVVNTRTKICYLIVSKQDTQLVIDNSKIQVFSAVAFEA